MHINCRIRVNAARSVSDAAHFSVVAQSLAYYIQSSLSSAEISEFDGQIDLLTSSWFKQMMG